MLLDRYIEREVERRMRERSIQHEMWDRMDRMDKRLEELRFEVECLKPEYRPECEAKHNG